MKVAFLDRDGVINEEIDYLHRISDFKYTKKCVDGLIKLSELGFQIVIITNQAGIAKGYFTEKQYHELTDWLIKDLKEKSVPILEVKFCPHHEEAIIEKYRRNCPFRKPGTGMIDQVVEDYDVDLNSSILIGDKQSDIDAGLAAGVGKCFLMKSDQTPLNTISYDNIYEISIAIEKSYLHSKVLKQQ